VEVPQELECGGHRPQERAVCLGLLTEVVLCADHEILRLPDEAGWLFLAHATAVLSGLWGWLGRPTATLLAPFVALAFEAVFDGASPVQEQLVHLLAPGKDAELRLDVIPGALQSLLRERGAIGHDHLGGASALFEGLAKRVQVVLIVCLDQCDGHCKVP
jgi:hypothetical protein